MELDERSARRFLQLAIARQLRQLPMLARVATISGRGLEAVTDAAAEYLMQLGSAMHDHAEHAGRTQATMHDVFLVLVARRVRAQPIASLLPAYARAHFLIPPADATLMPPLSSAHNNVPDAFKVIMAVDEPDPLPAHVPSFMPPFPAKHAYKQTPMFQHREHDQGRIRFIGAQQSLQIQNHLQKFIERTEHVPTSIILNSSNIPLDASEKQSGNQQDVEAIVKNILSMPIVNMELQSV